MCLIADVLVVGADTVGPNDAVGLVDEAHEGIVGVGIVLTAEVVGKQVLALPIVNYARGRDLVE